MIADIILLILNLTCFVVIFTEIQYCKYKLSKYLFTAVSYLSFMAATFCLIKLLICY